MYGTTRKQDTEQLNAETVEEDAMEVGKRVSGIGGRDL
jgi:hypothetical protein